MDPGQPPPTRVSCEPATDEINKQVCAAWRERTELSGSSRRRTLPTAPSPTTTHLMVCMLLDQGGAGTDRPRGVDDGARGGPVGLRTATSLPNRSAPDDDWPRNGERMVRRGTPSRRHVCAALWHAAPSGPSIRADMVLRRVCRRDDARRVPSLSPASLPRPDRSPCAPSSVLTPCPPQSRASQTRRDAVRGPVERADHSRVRGRADRPGQDPIDRGRVLCSPILRDCVDRLGCRYTGRRSTGWS